MYWVQLISNSICFVLCLFLFPEPFVPISSLPFLHDSSNLVHLADAPMSSSESDARSCRQSRVTRTSSKDSKERRACSMPSSFRSADRCSTSSLSVRCPFSLVQIGSRGFAAHKRTRSFRRTDEFADEPFFPELATAIVASLALWVGFAWGVVFLLVGSIAHVFERTYAFSQGQGGTVLICGFIGAFVSYILHLTVQEPLYRKALAKGNGKAKPEVRLYSAAIGGILFSAGSFAFAWTARPWIHWIVPCIFICVFNIGMCVCFLSPLATSLLFRPADPGGC